MGNEALSLSSNDVTGDENGMRHFFQSSPTTEPDNPGSPNRRNSKVESLVQQFQQIGYAISMPGTFRRATEAYARICRMLSLPLVMVVTSPDSGASTVTISLPQGMQFTKAGKRRLQEAIAVALARPARSAKVGTWSVTQPEVPCDHAVGLAAAFQATAKSADCISPGKMPIWRSV